MTTPTPFRFPVHSFRRIATPLDGAGYRNYLAVVDVAEVPDFSEWRHINIRDPKLTGAVPHQIRDGLREKPDLFFFMNRGLVVMADQVFHDNKSGTLSLVLSDPQKHGLLDGGHTWKILLEEKDMVEDDHRPYVRMEIMAGFDIDEIVEVVGARNTSNQVRDQSLLNLAGKFSGLKAEFRGKPYEHLIAYAEYEILDDESGKPIDVRDIVSLLTVFDKEQYDERRHPIIAYSSKAACLKRFENNPESYQRIYPLAGDILELWDKIHLSWPEWYRDSRAQQGQGARFGRITGVKTLTGNQRRVKLHFLDQESDYVIPSAFKYPILAAMRALTEEANGRYRWRKGLSPVDVLNTGLGRDLAEAVASVALEARNPNKTGKSSVVWDLCYSRVVYRLQGLSTD